MAANTDKLRKSYSFLQKSLGGSIGDSDSSLTLNNYTNIPTDTAVDFIIDRIDANGNRTNDKREIVTGVCTGSAITGLVRGVHGTTAQAHDGGAIVEFVASGAAWNDAMDAILEEHNQDGTHDNTKVVMTSGAQTIAGVKTFSSIPVLPANTVDTPQLAPDAATPDKRGGGFYVGNITIANSTGNQSFTGIGFKPKLVEFVWLTGDSGSNTTVCQGAMSENGNQFFAGTSVSAGGYGRNSLTTRCMGTMIGGSSAVLNQCSFVSMDADGFTINKHDTTGTITVAIKCYA